MLNKKSLILLALLSLLTSCSSFKKKAFEEVSSSLYEASSSIEKESQWENFKDFLPGELKLTEMLLEISSEDQNLLAILTKGYAGKAFIVDETILLEDRLSKNMDTQNEHSALVSYAKAIDYAKSYFKLRTIPFEENFVDEKKLSLKRDREVLFYLGLSLMGTINLRKSHPEIVAYLPTAQRILRSVCEKEPDILAGSCEIFSAIFETARPKMLGGNPELGAKMFEEILTKKKDHHLARVFYMEHVLIPQENQKRFKEEMEILKVSKKAFEESLYFSPEEKREVGTRIFNALAFKRYEIFKKLQKEIFQ